MLSIPFNQTGSTVTHLYRAGSFTETIPSGFTNLVIEVWGASGGAGGYIFNSSHQFQAGGGGGSGSYGISSTLSVIGQGTKTISVTVGSGGAAGVQGQPGVAGTGSSVSSGTFSLTTITTNGGAGGQIFTSPGVGGVAGSGGATNTPGNPGIGSAGGGGVQGLRGTGTPGGSITTNGGPGLAIFYYS